MNLEQPNPFPVFFFTSYSCYKVVHLFGVFNFIYGYLWFFMVFYLFWIHYAPVGASSSFEPCTGSTQGKEHKDEVGVLRQALVPDLRKAEDPFRDEEDCCSPSRLLVSRAGGVRFFLFFGELLFFVPRRLSQIKCAGRFFRNSSVLPM